MEQDLSALCKTAGARTALEDLGFEKQAIFATLAKPLGWLGQKAVGAVAKRGMPRLARGMETVGKGMGTDAMMFGTLGGGLSAATAPEGERGKAFARGFLGGAAGGAAWAGGQNIARAGAKGLLGLGGKGAHKTLGEAGTARWDALREAGKSHHWLGLGSKKPAVPSESWNPFTRWKGTLSGGGPAGERLSRFGKRIGTGAPLLAGGLGASMMVPNEIDLGGALASKQQNQLPFQQDPRTYGGPLIATHGRRLYYQ